MFSVTTLVRWCILAFILIAAWMIVQPFLGAALLAAVLVVSTWPVNVMLSKKIPNRALRATVLIVVWFVVLAGPLTGLGYVAAENLNTWVGQIREYIQNSGLPTHLPTWMQKMPWVGPAAQDYWFKLTHNKDEVTRLLHMVVSPATDVGWGGVQKLLKAATQLLGALAIAWFMYFEGARIGHWIERIANRIENGLGPLLLQRAVMTVRAVMLGLVGSAIGQAIAMAVGLAIAGVPPIAILTAATFFLSLIPGGPVVIWGGAAAWLYSQGQPGWAVFMVVWGVVVVSSVDNILKPILMSKGSDQSLLLMTLGVFGGALAFGFVGLFLGPIVLGVVSTLLDVWLEQVEEPARFVQEQQDALIERAQRAGPVMPAQVAASVDAPPHASPNPLLPPDESGKL